MPRRPQRNKPRGVAESSRHRGRSRVRERAAADRKTIGRRNRARIRERKGKPERTSKASLPAIRAKSKKRKPSQKVGGRKGLGRVRVEGRGVDWYASPKKWVLASLLICIVSAQACVRTVYLPQDAAYYRARWEEAVKRQVVCEDQLQKCVNDSTASASY